MSCARPVILAVTGQAQQILESANAGVCIQPGDSGALCDAILQLQQNRALGEKLGHNGREYIVQNLSRSQTADNYLEVLNAIPRKWPSDASGTLNEIVPTTSEPLAVIAASADISRSRACRLSKSRTVSPSAPGV
jgi:hypothetical protein